MKVNYLPISDNRYSKPAVQNKPGNIRSDYEQVKSLSDYRFNANFFTRGVNFKSARDDIGEQLKDDAVPITGNESDAGEIQEQPLLAAGNPENQINNKCAKCLSVSELNAQLYQARIEYMQSANPDEFPPYNIAPVKLNKTQFEIAKAIRWEYPEYISSSKKMRQGQALKPEENKFIDNVLKSLAPLEKDVTLYRSIRDFPGLQEQLDSGIFTDAAIMSTSKTAEGWIDFWGTPNRDYATGEITKQSYVLRLSVPKGTQALDLGGSYKKFFGKQVVASGWSNEVVLPPNTKWEVGNINQDLGIIDLKLIQDNADANFPLAAKSHSQK